MLKPVHKALTIAGSDSGGGAGIQADLKTFMALHVYGMSAITAITVQNTQGVHGIYDVPLEGIVGQIEAVVTDIGVDAVKTGMLANASVIEAVVRKLKQLAIPFIIVDPVMIAKGGASLLAEEAISSLRSLLLPIASVVTPNLPEAEVLLQRKILDVEDMKRAAIDIVSQYGAKCAIVKGGHLEGAPTDVLFDGENLHIYTGERCNTRHTHGTGCTFSAAITAFLAKGYSVVEAVASSKSFIQAAIQHELGLGNGHGPTNHWAYSQLDNKI